MPRILITGGSGLLALNWACCMRDSCEVLLAQHTRSVALRNTRSVPLCLESTESLARSLEQLQPELVVHAAGLTSVDLCELQPELAQRLNVALAVNVARATRRLGISLAHISTDHLFSGTRALYTESDPPLPLNVYARTKLLAEQSVTRENPAAMIVRTNFFGWGHRYRQSLSDWILASLRNDCKVSMFEDVFFTPILADRLASSVHELISHHCAGIYHVGGDERLSKYEFAIRLAHVFELPDSLVQRARISALNSKVVRPRDMSLDNSRARTDMGSSLGGVDEFLRQLKEQERLGRAHELFAAVLE